MTSPCRFVPWSNSACRVQVIEPFSILGIAAVAETWAANRSTRRVKNGKPRANELETWDVRQAVSRSGGDVGSVVVADQVQMEAAASSKAHLIADNHSVCVLDPA